MLLVVCMVLGVLAGCSSTPTNTTGESTDSAANTESTKSSESTSSSTAKTDSTDSGKEKVIRITLGEGAKTYDHTLNEDGDGTGVLIHMFDALVYEDRGKVVPAAAKSWDISSDGLTYTFHIDEKSMWSDGKPVRAQDFEYAFKRLANPMTASGVAGSAFFIKNGIAVVNGDLPVEELGVRTIDDSTLEVVMAAPGEYSEKSLLNLFPLREDIVSADPDRWALDPATLGVSNGAFKCVELKQNESMTLVKNDKFRNADKVKIDKMEYYFIPDSSTALNSYLAGDLECVARVPASQVQTLLVENPEFYLTSSFGLEYLEFNTAVKPFDDERVRKAFSLAMDRKKLAEKVMGSGVIPAAALVSPGYVVGDTDFRNYSEESYDIDISGPNVAMAQQLMKDAGYPGGKGFPKVILTSEAVSTSQRMSEAFVEMWREHLGVEVEISAKEFQVMYDELREGDFQVVGNITVAGFAHPLAPLDIFIKGSDMNFTNFTSPVYDKLVHEAKMSLDKDVAVQKMHEAEDFIMNKHIIAPMFYTVERILVKPYVVDYQVINSYRDFNYADVDSSQM